MSTRRRPLRHPAVVSLGCNCRRPRIFGLPVKKSKPKPPPAAVKKAASPPPRPSTSSCSWERFFSGDELSSSTAFSSSKASHNSPDPRGFIPPVLGGSVAVVKTSDNPYNDFRNSMVQMILENEIYSRDDLCELLRCLLSLNSPFHHDAILRAFAEIVDGFFS